jgi:hypothetical protein
VFLLIFVFLVSLVVLSFALSFFGLKRIDLQGKTSEVKDDFNEQNHNEEKDLLMKYGKKFGVSVDYQFDDSMTVGFKFGYYLSGLNIGLISDDSESYEFRYSPDQFPDHIHSMAHGKQFSTRLTFNFLRSERITAVEGSLRPIEHHLANGTNGSFDAVTGLRFFSSNDRWSYRFLDPDRGTKF